MPADISSWVQSASFHTDTESKTVTVSYQAGDVIVVASAVASGNMSIGAPTATGLTFTQRQGQDLSASNTEVTFWTAKAASSGTNVVITCTYPAAGSDGWGMCAWVITSADDYTTGFINSNETATNLTVPAGAVVCYICSDWNAQAAADGTMGMTTGSGTTWTRFNDGTTATHNVLIGDWENTSAGTFAFGLDNYSPGGATLSVTQAAIVIAPLTTSVPDAVNNLSGTPGNTQVSLSWSAPNANNSAITDYVVQYVNANLTPNFPTIPTVAGGRVLTGQQANTSTTRTFPDLSGLTKNAGDLLIAICIGYQSGIGTSDTAFSSWGGGFTEFVDSATSTTMAIGAAYKWSTGSETGTFTVQQSATITGHAVFILLSIPGAHATTPPEAGGRVSTTAATLADPTALNPAGWGTEKTLWIAVHGDGETSLTGSYTGVATPPTNYTNYVDTGMTGDAIGVVEGAVAFRQLEAASEDAGAFGADTSNSRHAALLIAVRPAEVAWSTFSDGTSATPGATVTGLANGTPYNFRVAAVNGIGQAPWSNVAGPYTPSAPLTERMKRWNGSTWVPVVMKHGATWGTVITKDL